MKDNININYGPLPEYIAENKKEYLDLIRSPLQDYCKEAIQQFGYLDNQGLALDDDDNQSGPVYIDDLYVLPKAGVERISPEMLAKIDDVRDIENDSEEINDVKNKVDQLSSIAELIWKNPRLTFLGDPGVGKTTLMQWLICSLCHWSNNHAKQYLGTMFPLTITARKISEKTIDDLNFGELDLESFVDEILLMQGDQLNRLWGVEEKAFLYSLFERGQVLLLVDGLDEISSNTGLWLNNKVRDLLLKYPSTHLIMTARVVGFNQFDFWGIAKRFRDKEMHVEISETPIEFDEEFIQASKNIQLHLPEIFFLAPFSPGQRKRFSENWVANYLPPIDEKKNSFIENIDEVSTHSLQLDALSRIPVLLNLICFIQWRRGKLPNGRAELYQRIVETYLVAMDRARLLTHELSDEYDYQDIKNWLGRLAFNMQSGDLKILEEGRELFDYNEEELERLRNDIPKINSERVLQVSSKDLKKFFQLHLTEVLPFCELEKHSEAIIAYLKNRTGFLIPRGVVDNLETFGFSHLSFQEYFCAYFLNNTIDDFCEEDVSNIIEVNNKESWGEILQLFFEEMSLTGRSRNYVDKKLKNIFPFDKVRGGNIDIVRKHGSIFPTYTKIISNPSIKVSNSARKEKKKELALMYVSGYILQHPLITTVANEVFGKYISEDIMISPSEVDIVDMKFLNIASIIDYDAVKVLSLKDIDVDEYEFENKFENLIELGLTGSTLSSIERICTPERIRKLNFINTAMSDCKSFERMTGLTELHITNKVFSTVYKSFTSLIKLSVILDNKNYLEYLTDLKGLKDLRLIGADVSKFPSKIIGQELENLEMYGGFDINVNVGLLLSELTSLKHITLHAFSEYKNQVLVMDGWGELCNVESITLNIECSIDVSELPKGDKFTALFVYRGNLLSSDELLEMSALQFLTVRTEAVDPEIIKKLQAKGVDVSLL